MSGAYRPVFNKDQEEEILQVILDMDQRFYGFTGRDVRILPFVMAEKNKIAHPFNEELQMAAVTTTQAKNSKVLALKGRRQVGALSSAGTAVIWMKIELTEGAPPRCTFACSDSGWMNLHIFEQWWYHFISSEKDPLLLILDGYTKNLAIIKKARENNVERLCLPPHCSHKLQPLDVSFNFPLNTYYVQSPGSESWARYYAVSS
ncbi:hypothetical protein JTB14_000307 [Gonioctena quinquepunctata]|nr:hypothetical protein JTB14_000307 [Gonioctena quinquepunctata]